MTTAHLQATGLFAGASGGFSYEWGIIGFAVLMALLLLIVRAKRSHDQKLRRAAASGFYDFDVAHYGHGSAGSSLLETTVAAGARPLAPTFVAPKAGGEDNGGAVGPAPVRPMPIPSSFAAADRSLSGPVPAFDREVAAQRRPPPESSAPRPPAAAAPLGPPPPPPPPPGTEAALDPEAPAAPPPPPPAGSSLPRLVQPPPPSPGARPTD
jgi:hypothetical protein